MYDDCTYVAKTCSTHTHVPLQPKNLAHSGSDVRRIGEVQIQCRLRRQNCAAGSDNSSSAMDEPLFNSPSAHSPDIVSKRLASWRRAGVILSARVLLSSAPPSDKRKFLSRALTPFRIEIGKLWASRSLLTAWGAVRLRGENVGVLKVVTSWDE